LAAYLRPDLSGTSRVVVHFVEPGSYASEFLSPGAVVTKLNGHTINTLSDFREFFIPDGLKKGASADVAVEDAEEEESEEELLREEEAQGDMDDSTDDSETDEESELSFLATRHHSKGRKKQSSRPKSGSGNSSSVWTLETDRGEIYAVFFDETLKNQVLLAEAQQSQMLLSAAVVDAAVQRQVFAGTQPPPFVRSMLDHRQRKAPAMMAVERSTGANTVDSLPTAIFADVPIIGRSAGWRPTVLHSVPRSAEL
jgi:hypothetical protein